MLSQRIRDWIKLRVYSCYARRYTNEHTRNVILEESLDLFDLFNELNTSCINFEQGIIDMEKAGDLERKDYMRNFNILEIFMKALYNVVHTETYTISSTNIGNVDMEAYAGLLKDVYHIFSPTFNLTDTNPETVNQGFKREHLISYQKRNFVTHRSNNTMQDLDEVNKTIAAVLVSYLDLCYTYKDALKAKVSEVKRANYINKDSYCQEVLEENKKYFHGFTYIDIAWKDDRDSSSAVTLSQLLSSSDNHLKLVGEAGSGKTTALKRAEYLMAKTVRESGKGPVPVYLTLNELLDGTNIIARAAARKLNITLKETLELIKHSEVALLLDGFNEILDNTLKRKIASEIDELGLKNEKLKVILTDRSLSKRDMPVFTQARRLILFEMSLDDKIRFIKANSPDAETKTILLQEARECPETFVTIKTPLALKQLIEVVREYREVPLDITEAYINALLKRELEEKKDININYLPYHLQALAVLNNDIFSRDDALEQIALVNRIKGFTTPDSLACLSLAIDLGILQCEGEDNLCFSTEMYHLYFRNSCRDNKLKEKINEFRS